MNARAVKENLSWPDHQVNGHVWVVDDDRMILDLCALIFSKHNITYELFEDAEALLAAPIPDDLKYILIDLRLPDLSGTVLCRRLKPQLPEQVKCIAVTAQVFSEERGELLSDGFDHVLLKPFRANDLLRLFTAGHTERKIKVDPEILHQMTYGDAGAMDRIWKSFKQDCRSDIAALHTVITAGGWPEASLIVHCLAGRTAQIGASELAGVFRQMEQHLLRKENPGPETRRQLNEALADLQQLMEEYEPQVIP